MYLKVVWNVVNVLEHILELQCLMSILICDSILTLIAFFATWHKICRKEKWGILCPTFHMLCLRWFCHRVITHLWKGASSRAKPTLEGCVDTPVCPSRRALGQRRSGSALQLTPPLPMLEALSYSVYRHKAWCTTAVPLSRQRALTNAGLSLIAMKCCHLLHGAQILGVSLAPSLGCPVVCIRTRDTPLLPWNHLVPTIIKALEAEIVPSLRRSRGPRAAKHRPRGREASLRRKAGLWGTSMTAPTGNCWGMMCGSGWQIWIQCLISDGCILAHLFIYLFFFMLTCVSCFSCQWQMREQTMGPCFNMQLWRDVILDACHIFLLQHPRLFELCQSLDSAELIHSD